MPSILSEDDKQTVKRTVPKGSNKIHAVAVAKLYIAHPNRQRWTYTGLQGAAVLANDLVGNTYWIKLVDVSPANRGVLWDQEIYDSWQYHQDRTFFHTFELEDCLAGLSFADEKEAKQFKKKMEEREKNAHKNTKSRPFASGPAQTGSGGQQQSIAGGKSHGLFGGLFSSHKQSTPQAPAQSVIPPRGVEINAHGTPTSGHGRSTSDIDFNDPAVQTVLQELLAMGITEDQLRENEGFIKQYLEQHKADAAKKEARAPPPPPPPGTASLAPQDTGGSRGGRGPPPAPPPSRRSAGGTSPAMQQPSTPSPPPREPSPPRPRFRVPPPLADAGKLAHENNAPALPGRNRATSQSTAGPPPPPRPPKVPEDDSAPPPLPPGRHAVPPPFEGKRAVSGPPAPPPRSSGPPAPPPRESPSQIGSMPPPPPPRSSHAPSSPDTSAPPPPPLPPTSSRPIPPAPANGGPPPPPPLPPPSTSGPPAPPPLPASSSGGPPPPPPMPPRGAAPGVGDDTAAAAAAPRPSAPGRDGLLADIRGGARLKKVSDSEKRDRSGAMVPGSEPAAPAPPSAGGAGGGGDAGGGLAGALASALAARKSKVSHSDDEGDDDEW